jgi:hypothetical protein
MAFSEPSEDGDDGGEGSAPWRGGESWGDSRCGSVAGFEFGGDLEGIFEPPWV